MKPSFDPTSILSEDDRMYLRDNLELEPGPWEDDPQVQRVPSP